MHEITEPAYPLTKAAFTRALMTGHGRALIHAERCGTDGVREEILNSALFPNVYDAQCNGLGEAWLARLCQAAGLVERFISQDRGITGDLELRCGMLAQFALQGHHAPRTELRELCRYDEKKGWVLGAGEIVEVDGEEGFLFAADRVGAALLEHPDYWGSTYLARLLDEKAGEGRAMAIMNRESSGNPNIAAFREAVLKSEAEPRPRPVRIKPSVDELLEQILHSEKPVPYFRSSGKHATPDEGRFIAALDFQKLNPVALENYLRFFNQTGFPELWEEHLALLTHPEKRVRQQAHATMSHHADPELRKAAYETLARGEVSNFVSLLHRFARRRDTGPMLEAISAPGAFEDDFELHGTVLDLLHLVEKKKRMKDARLAVWIYENSPCRRCRHDAVKKMAEHSILPTWIAEECLSDAYDETREIAAKHLGVEQRF
jgi:hypothetical protein